MIRPSRFRLLTAQTVAVLLLASFFGCAPKQPVEPLFDAAVPAWRAFRQNYCVPPEEPGMKIKASLHYTREVPDKRSDRTRVSIWGNMEGPVRLDVSATFGRIVAMIREDQDGLLVFYPTEDRAYGHANSVLGATRLGMPFPFSLTELARVAMGDFSGLVPATFVEAKAENGHFIYTLENGLASSITLDGNGLPIIIEGVAMSAYESARKWRLVLERYEEDPTLLPSRLTLTMDNGERGVLRIKSREFRMDRWPERATELTLPDDTLFYWLDGRDDSAG